MKKILLILIPLWIFSFALSAKNNTKSAQNDVVELSDTPLKFRIYDASVVEVVKDDSYKSLKSIVIPDKVRIEGKVYKVYRIGLDAFSECSDLKSVTIPSGLDIYSYYHFDKCDKLKEIKVDSNNQSNASMNGVLYDKNKTRLILVPRGYKGNLAIPSTVTRIAENACSGCANLKSIKIPPSVGYVGNDAFQNCSALKEVNIPEGIKHIHPYSFNGCSSLEKIELPSSLLDYLSFSNCPKLKTINVSPDNERFSSVDGVLYDKDRKRLLRVPEGYKGDFDVPSGVTFIASAFVGCNGVTSVTIPQSVTKISVGAFGNCSRLTHINVLPGNRFYVSVDGVLYTSSLWSIYSVPNGIKGRFEIPADVVKIEEGAFSGCDGLTEVKIPEGVKAIWGDAFHGCSRLKHVVIPSSVVEIRFHAFRGCKALESVEIKNGVKYIGSWAFDGCERLTNILIPSSVKELGSSVFKGCRNLDVVVENSPENINTDDSFNGCKSVKFTE
ncbi:MAG: leucine-rich repeat domain-containing protein [Paludibacteraceae bacterium]|nr:leucine-rich repeat domain-containing protein [Paludibacteraceae bacterium]